MTVCIESIDHAKECTGSVRMFQLPGWAAPVPLCETHVKRIKQNAFKSRAN